MRNQYLYKHMIIKSVEQFEERFVYNKSLTKEEAISSQLLHKEVIFLLSYITIKNKVGIIGAKKVLTFEYLRMMLKKKNTPYYIKRVYLKFLFEVYIRY